jgi:6-phosphogluconolactonase
MKMGNKMPAAVFAVVMLMASCQKEKTGLPEGSEETTQAAETSAKESSNRNNEGFVYTMSNQTSDNMILAYRRAADGMLEYAASYATGGNGSGAGLGNQGAVVLDDEEDVLLVVNPGSNSISSFKINGNGSLNLKSTVNSGGVTPVSIAISNNLVYVLNSGGSGNISGFRLGENKKLVPIPHSSRPLSSSSAGAAQISFVRNGKVLVITEKATNKIITYTVNHLGLPGAMHSITAASATPFGFAPGHFGNIYVSEAVGGAPNASNVSSYHIGWNGAINLTEGPVATGQTAACWVVLTGNEQFIYVTNTGSNNLSSYTVHPATGNINLLHSNAASSGMGPIDAALSDNSKFLYALNGGGGSISAYSVSNNGTLASIQTLTGIPSTANGLAAD